MATTSSARKAAQVAARSGSSSKKGKNWLFPVAIVAIIVLGVGIVMVARDQNVGVGDNDEAPLAQLTEGGAYDHWHSAFALNVCGNELGELVDAGPDILGIHAHSGEKLIHIHPFSLKASGERATMQRFFDQVGLVVTDTGFQTPDGEVYSEEETTCGGEATELTMAYWQKPLETMDETPDEIYTEAFGSVRFREDRSAYALALLPKGDVPAFPAGLSDLYSPSDLGQESQVPDVSLPDVTAEVTDPAAEGSESTDGSTADGSTPEGTEGAEAAGGDPAADGATDAASGESADAGSGG